jgi:hypothetical protein
MFHGMSLALERLFQRGTRPSRRLFMRLVAGLPVDINQLLANHA